MNTYYIYTLRKYDLNLHGTKCDFILSHPGARTRMGTRGGGGTPGPLPQQPNFRPSAEIWSDTFWDFVQLVFIDV
jgi:hypothetical protein